jgi:hypothetical protein
MHIRSYCDILSPEFAGIKIAISRARVHSIGVNGIKNRNTHKSQAVEVSKRRNQYHGE